MHGGCHVTDEKWKMEDEKWKMEDGRWKISSVSF
jgi:hypothetical protein